MPSAEVIEKLELLHKELMKLEPAIRHIETAQLVTQTVLGIPQKHIQLLDEIAENDRLNKAELKKQVMEELSLFTGENNALQAITRQVLGSVKEEQAAITKLKDVILQFHERIAGINFPERLDRMDANIAGIMATVQAVQSRVDIIERNLSDRLKEMGERQLAVAEELKGTAKKQQVLLYVIVAVSLATGIITMFGLLGRM